MKSTLLDTFKSREKVKNYKFSVVGSSVELKFKIEQNQRS
jgi:hypothetical protein